jgi:hypothetical protein
MYARHPAAGALYRRAELLHDELREPPFTDQQLASLRDLATGLLGLS